ncbi:MAG: hemerythrin domain-containing protein [Myxococcota bacterium]
MNAILLLKQQHARLLDLFRRYREEPREPPEVRQGILTALTEALLAHATVEERHFYRAVTSDQTEGYLRQCMDDHTRVRQLVSELLARSPDDTELPGCVSRLERAVEEHLTREEQELFALVERVLDRQTLDALGSVMEPAYEEIQRTPPPASLSSETAYPGGLR